MLECLLLTVCVCTCVCVGFCAFEREQQQDDDNVTRSNLIMLFMMELVPGWLRIIFVSVRAYFNEVV